MARTKVTQTSRDAAKSRKALKAAKSTKSTKGAKELKGMKGKAFKRDKEGRLLKADGTLFKPRRLHPGTLARRKYRQMVKHDFLPVLTPTSVGKSLRNALMYHRDSMRITAGALAVAREAVQAVVDRIVRDALLSVKNRHPAKTLNTSDLELAVYRFSSHPSCHATLWKRYQEQEPCDGFVPGQTMSRN